MNTITKIGATAAAIGALGVAGSFGTFSAFTAESAPSTSQFKTGSVKIDNEFALPTLDHMATQQPAKAGYIKVTNTGTEPANVWMDFDGPTGNITPQGSASPTTDNPLVDNIIVDSSYDADFAHLMDDQTRLFRINNRGLSPLPSATDPLHAALVVQPGQSGVVYFRARLRERLDGGSDNVNQLQAVTETVTVKAIEAGGTTFGTYGPQPADGGN
jgi:hypothetical protein